MYDLIIIGAGPAGLTAAIYASCFKLNHLIIAPLPGGQMTLAPDILNYPGFEEISGMELTDKMVDQVKKRGGQIIIDSAQAIHKTDQGFTIITESKTTYETKTIILATGVERRKLDVPGENEYTAKGVQYCATCERFDYKDKLTVVVGGANAAAQTAMQLSHAATKVYILCRGEKLACDPIWTTQIEETKIIEPLYNKKVLEILGDGQQVTGIKIASTKTQQEETLPVNRIFIEIGGVPGTALLLPLGLALDEKGFMVVDEQLATNISGIYAAGDVVNHKYSIEQISSAVGLGARAAVSILTYLKQQKAPKLWGNQQIPQSNAS